MSKVLICADPFHIGSESVAMEGLEESRDYLIHYIEYNKLDNYIKVLCSQIRTHEQLTDFCNKHLKRYGFRYDDISTIL